MLAREPVQGLAKPMMLKATSAPVIGALKGLDALARIRSVRMSAMT